MYCCISRFFTCNSRIVFCHSKCISYVIISIIAIMGVFLVVIIV